MTIRRLSYSLVTLLLTSVLAAPAADKDAFGDPLPDGAKLRLGTIRGGPTGMPGLLMPPKFEAFLLPWQSGFALHDMATGKVTELPTGDLRDLGNPLGLGIRMVLAVSADGKRVVAEMHAGSYVVMELATGKVFQTIQARNLGFRSTVSLSADGKRFAHGMQPRMNGDEVKVEVVVWDVDKNADVMRVDVVQNESASVVLSSDGKTLATFGTHSARNPPQPAKDAVRPDQIVQVWDVKSGKQLATIAETRDYAGVKTVAFAPDGKTLVTASWGGYVALWNAADGKLKDELVCRTTQGERFAFAPDGKTLAAIDRLGAIERWALPAAEALKATACPIPGARPGVVGNSFGVTDMVFADNDRVVACGQMWNRTVAWEAPSGKLLTPVPDHLSEIESVQFAANGREVVTVSREARIVRWDALTGKVIARTSVDTEENNYARNAPVMLAPGGKGGLRAAVVIDPDTGTEVFRLPGEHAFPSTDFTRALAVDRWLDPMADATPGAIWNLETRKRQATLQLPARVNTFDPGLFMVAFSPDDSRMVTVIHNPSGGYIVTGWDAKTGKKLGEFEDKRLFAIFGLAAANNNGGAMLASRDGRLWVAEYEKGARADTIDELPRGRWFTRPTFSPDGKLLAVGAPIENWRGSEVRFYSWPQGKLVHTFAGQTGTVSALAFSSDGKALASGSSDGSVLIWDLTKIEKSGR
jgi:WD40 repeat protein